MQKKYQLFIASDHAGFSLKSAIIRFLSKKKIIFNDLGTYNDITSVDYPDYAHILVDALLEETQPALGILICGTGIGMSIAANRNTNIRAALCFNTLMAERARNHNNANVLILGSKLISPGEACDIVQTFLINEFEGGRHITRINKIK